MDIPCPAVFAWNDDPDNPVHYPYTLMEKADGELLGELWYPENLDNVMSIGEKVDALDALSKLYVSMTRPIGEYFQSYGSIFFDKAYLESALNDPRSYTVSSLVYSYPVDKNAPNIRLSASPSNDIRDIWRQLYHTHWAEAQRQRGSFATDGLDNDLGDTKLDNWEQAEMTAADLLQVIERIEIPDNLRMPSLVQCDFALRNVMYDKNNHKICSVLDWDDVAILGF